MLMFLPPELLTLVVLGTAVGAFPQDSVPVADSISTNATATIPGDTDRLITSETPETPETPEIPDEVFNPCEDPKSCGHREMPELPTATGFDDTEETSIIITPTTQVNVVVTSNVPTIIGLETNTLVRGGEQAASPIAGIPVASPIASVPATSPKAGVPAAAPIVGVPIASLGEDGADAERNVGQPNTAVQKDTTISPGSPERPAATPVGAILSTVNLPNPQPTSQNSLLLDVVSRLGQTGFAAQPTSPSSGTTKASGENPPVNSVAPSNDGGITPGPGMPTVTSPPPVTGGNSITLGSAVLTLTPGVSTTIGPSSDQTFIAITTNVAGSTLVTISSSGTIVTATVSSTPTVVTLSKTGFEASITSDARSQRFTGKLNSATSTGLAVENKRSEVGWWTSVILGFLPFVFGL